MERRVNGYIAPDIDKIYVVTEQGFALSESGNMENPEDGGEI